MRYLLIMLGLISVTQVFAQTWLEKENNGLDYGSTNPPSTPNVNLYSEPFDLSWRNGFTGIGTTQWPQTRLQVHSNDNVDTELDNFLTSLGINYPDISTIVSNGGTVSDPVAAAILAFVSRSNVPGAANVGFTGQTRGDNVGTNIGCSFEANGDNNGEVIGSTNIAAGDGNEQNIGMRGIADGDGLDVGNFGVIGQCNSANSNSVNVGVKGRGVLGDDHSLVNIGVHGEAVCSPNFGGQFNCGVYGQNSGCNSATVSTNPNYPAGNWAGYFNGDVAITGTLWNPPSDASLKENIELYGNALEKLSKLDVYTYNYRTDKGLSLPAGKEYGVMAQEVEKVFPELVKPISVITNEEPFSYRNIETYKGIKYMSFIPLLIQGQKELNDKLQMIDPENALGQLTQLEAKIEALERNLQTTAVANENLEGILTVYPNPSSGIMTIELNQLPCDDCKIMITDLAGKLLKEISVYDAFQKITLNAGDFSSGIYQCNLVGDGKLIGSTKIAFSKN